jgi:hypothetical protein
VNKFLIIIFIFSLPTLMSCGKSASKTDAKIYLTNNFIVSGQAGGVLLFGEHKTLPIEFTTEVSTSQSITLENGTWNFHAISWEGPSSFEGTSRCASSGAVEISPSNAAVSLSLSAANCLTPPDLTASRIFGDLFQSSLPDQFKSLTIHTCDEVDGAGTGCAASATNPITGSFEVVLTLDPIIPTSPPELTGDCETLSLVTTGEYSRATSGTFPGSTSLPMITTPKIVLHTSTDCTDANPIYYDFYNGIDSHEDQENGNATLISDIDTSNADVNHLYIQHNVSTTNSVDGLIIVGDNLPASVADYTPITSVDVDLIGLEDNDVIYLYLNDATCANDAQALLGSVNVGVAPPDLNTISALVYPTNLITGTGGFLDYYIKVDDSVGNPLNFSSSASCELVNSVTDSTLPTSATSLVWSGASPTSTTALNNTWTFSASVDLTKQTVNYWTDAGCSVSAGPSNDLGPTATADTFTGSDGTTYYFNIDSLDAAGNSFISGCSAGMLVDTTAPTAATGVFWSESDPTPATTLNLNWTVSASGDVASQDVQVYSDGSCTTPFGAPTTLGAAAASTSFAGASDATTYSFDVKSIDNAGNFVISTCSPAITVDTTSPISSSGESWAEASPANTTSINLSWTPSGSGDVSSQDIQLFSDGICGTPEGGPVSLGSAANTYNFTSALDGMTYSFSIDTTDFAGNLTSSSCSTSITIDTTVPIILNVSSPTADGTYGNPTVIDIVFTTSEPVIVSGVPEFTLDTTGVATYFSGSGTSSLTFQYTILGGHSSADLGYSNAETVNLNGGTLTDSALNNLLLDTPDNLSGSSLSDQKALNITP